MPSLTPPPRGTAIARAWPLPACAVALFLVACATAPSQEMSDARRAVDAAGIARAESLAPHAMSQASASLDRASAALRAGDYDTARAMARAARDEAITARTLANAMTLAENGIAAARAQSRPWEGAQRLLDEAMRLSRNGESTRALQMAERALALTR